MGHVLYVIPVAAGRERREAVGELLENWAVPGTRVTVEDIPGGPTDLEYAADGARAVHWLVENLPALVAGIGADAVCLGCFYDLGRREAREVLTVPVVGIAEAALRLAACVASRFAVLVGRPKWIPRMQDSAMVYGVAHQVVTWRSLGLTVEDMRADRGGIVFRRLLAEGERSVRDGAEAVILGCAALGEESEADLAAKLGVPVINPTRAGFKLAEMLADLHARFGLKTSKVGDYEGRRPG